MAKRTTMQVSELRDWARMMGYQGEIPDDFRLLNESTEHIWRQVIDRIKPREEILRRSRCILMEQLEMKKTGRRRVSHVVLNCPNEEYDAWTNRQELRKKLADKKRKVEETRKVIDTFNRETDELHLRRKIAEAKLKEDQAKCYLYEKQKENLVKSIETAKTKVKQLDEFIDITQRKRQQDNLGRKLENLALSNSDALREIYAQSDQKQLYEVLNQLSMAEISKIRVANNEFDSNMKITKEKQDEKCEQHLDKLRAFYLEISLDNIATERNLAVLDTKIHEGVKGLSAKHGVSEADIQRELEALEYEALDTYYTDCLFKPTVLKSRVVDLEYPLPPISTSELVNSQYEIKKKVTSIKSKTTVCVNNWHEVKEHHRKLCEDYTRIRGMSSIYATSEMLLMPLTAGYCTREVAALSVFNLEFNRKAYFTGENFYYHETGQSVLPFSSMKHDKLWRSMIRVLGMSPLQPGLVDYFKWREMHRRHMDTLLQADKGFVFDGSSNKYVLRDLLHTDVREMEVVHTAIRSLTGLPPLHCASVDHHEFQRSLKLYVEMPFDSYVPKKLHHDGKTFNDYKCAFYENYRLL